jgi:TatD DNase family protein
MEQEKKLFVNIHGHRKADNIQEWVMMNLFASEYPPDDIDHGYYSVGFHPYNVGKADEDDTLKKVRLATDNPHVLAVGEIGLDKSIEAPLDEQRRIFEKQVGIAESAKLPVILHVVRAFNEMLEFMKVHKPSVPMIIHGYNGSREMVEELVNAGFLISFGQALTGEHSKVIEALLSVPLEKLFLETDEGDLDIREIYAAAAQLKDISVDQLRVQLVRNAETHISRFTGPSQ